MFQAITSGSTLLRIGFLGVLAALLVSVGNAGGVGTTVAGVCAHSVCRGNRPLLAARFRQNPSALEDAVCFDSRAGGHFGDRFAADQINETVNGAYQILVDAATVIYFIPLLYMYAAAIKLAYRKDRAANPNAVLIPGGKTRSVACGAVGFLVVLGASRCR